MEPSHADSTTGTLKTEEVPLPPGAPPPPQEQQQPAAGGTMPDGGSVFLDDPAGGGPVVFTASLGGLEQHLQEQLVHVATHQCPVCGCFFLDQAEAEQHMKVHTTDADEAASTSKEVTSPPRQDQANKASTSGGQFCCPVCDRAFATVRSLRTHLLVHPGTKLHICQTCGRQFSDSSSLKVHVAEHVAERRFRCPVCGKAFGTSSHLKTHITLHSGRRPYQCEVCLKEFSVLSNLRSHMFIHTGERRHECQVCGKQFTSSSHLKTHMLTHSGERPHKCDLCPKSFAVISNLKAHRKIHLGQRDHHCDLCPKRFYTSSDLKSHRVMHTGERPHECPVCHERFSKRSNMKAHILTHSGARPHQCDVCCKRFSKASNLRAHADRCRPPRCVAAAAAAASPKTSASTTAATATAAAATAQGRPSARVVLARLRTPVPVLYRPSVAPTMTTTSCRAVRVSSREFPSTTTAFRRNNAPDIPSAMETPAGHFLAPTVNPLHATASRFNPVRVPMLSAFGSLMGRNHGVPLAVRHRRPPNGHALGMLRAVPYAAQFLRMALRPGGFVNFPVRPAMGMSRTGQGAYAEFLPIGQVQYATFMPTG